MAVLAVATAMVLGLLVGEAVPVARHPADDGRAPGDGTVTVRVVNEVDADGAYDHPLETGRPGVRVTLTDDHGTAVRETTGADGVALFRPAESSLGGGRYRIEVSNPDPANLQSAVAGLGEGPRVIRSSVGFVDVSGDRNATYTTGFWEPGVYCQENPRLVTCSLAKGDVTTEQGLTRFTGDFGNGYPGPAPTRLTDSGEQQAVYGIGTDRTGNTYMGTLVKRHAAYGPAGRTNTVYRHHSDSGVTEFITLPGTLTAHDSSDRWRHDDRIYSRVGREGLGDVDVSGDGRILYAVNLNDAKLYRVPILGTGDKVRAGTPSSYAVPVPARCEGEWHPYGIGVRGSRVLVGGVCGAENTVDKRHMPYGDPRQLSAHVYEFESGRFDEIFRHRLDYRRGCAYQSDNGPLCKHGSATAGGTLSAMWEAWNERVPTPDPRLRFASAPQPILSDLEIADNGDLILGYRDRFGDMQGNRTYAHNSRSSLLSAVAAGDLLRACERGPGHYVLERNAGCGALDGALPNNRRGPGGGAFSNDLTHDGYARHDQVTEGGTVLQPFRGRLWGTVYDTFTGKPFDQGVRRWDSESGTVRGNLRLQPTSYASADLFGKGNGLADLEMVCDQAPVQIGNRAWFDTNGNGVQDPSEPPIRGVKVTLDPTSYDTHPDLVTYTDDDGEYYFTSVDGLRPNTTYTATFDFSRVEPKSLPGRPSLSALKWTVKEAGSDRALDSDVDADGRTTVYVGEPGHVNHTIDAGVFKSLRLTLLKHDKKSNKPLPGAVFELWQDTYGAPGLQRDGSKQDRFVNDCATSTTGRCSFGSLPVGTYYLAETNAPEGYRRPRQPVTGPYVLTPKNAARGDGLRVKLVNARGEP
ncbi:SdrD B-like domain-containing protein [Streptomyces tailanensis]|uniref:SdrD B-like domain-containing protein n=1 Tax=Streptomyces tailanensis TaxID=2569858 RepID=UPI001FE5E9C9|nr:SdrD B-like domain-containing protein [Streptomyces tailanensis]